MVKIPFSVSARAARLIGRENVATSQGAMTELVKNSYDADAVACAILFLKRYSTVPPLLSQREFDYLRAIVPNLDKYYQSDAENLRLSGSLGAEELKALESALDDAVDLWIVDNGTGMTEEVIAKNWMVIGTDAKETNSESKGGRAVTGAKGIGRFALDRLGGEAEMLSAPADAQSISHWLVDWGDFEGDGKVIGDVTAILEVESRTLREAFVEAGLAKILPTSLPRPEANDPPLLFERGTAIKISRLNDRWDSRDAVKLRATLEALLPPRDQRDFNIFIYDYRLGDDGGWIDSFPPDQFDYSLRADVRIDGTVEIKINRQEIDVPRIRPSTFSVPGMDVGGYLPADFEAGEISYTKTLHQLLRRNEAESIEDFAEVGPFSFTLYYFKLSNPTKENLEKYPQKTFDVTRRRRWLTTSGGIRLYRDNFRVRPYGEPNTQGADWLLLGQRTAANPAAVSRMGWRVPPQQVAGTIHITKKNNPQLADQSNREGIMNERAFAAFRTIVLSIINEFEYDRSYIYSRFDKAYDLDHPAVKEVARGKKAASEALNDTSGAVDENTKDIARALKTTVQENDSLREEVHLLRGMATLGTVLVSFTHELKQIKANMDVRQKRMQNALDRVVDPSKLEKVQREASPYSILDRWGREDEKVSRWVDFALFSVAPTKRRRQQINIGNYLAGLGSHWKPYLDSKQATLKFDLPDRSDAKVLAHEIDLDSIFYNLIVNSVEAFTRPGSPNTRDIRISLNAIDNTNAKISYTDTGPGLADSFNFAEQIFEFGVSAKSISADGDVTGTGIGMWLLKSIVDDYGGAAVITSDIGALNFGIDLYLPLIKQ